MAKKKSTQPLVSVIIACKNTAKHIAACLESVRTQSYKNIEIIVVDNFSTDGTFEIAKKYADKACQKGPERSSQFNYGFAQANGEYIYRIGPDYILEPDVVKICVEAIRQGYDALALHNRSVGTSRWARVRYLERESYRNSQSIVAVRFMKRSVFKAIGMFDETLVAGEDFDLHNRLVAAGYTWRHVDAVENHVGEPRTIADVWRKFYYYGRTISRYNKKHPRKAYKQMAFFRPAYRSLLPQLIRRPATGVLFFVYLCVKYTAGFAGMIAGPPKSLPTHSSEK